MKHAFPPSESAMAASGPSARGFLAAVATLVLASCAPGWGTPARASEPLGIKNPLHGYDTQPPQDRFWRVKAALESGERTLDTSGELPLLRGLLRALEVPVSSQLLVTSATSLQKRLVSPRRPRAIYFNEDTYVGFVPGGQIEVLSIDPELGGMFYLFDRLTPGKLPRMRRSEDCMTCHASRHMEEIPGLVIESVVPGLSGGGEKAFRRERSGHGIPYDLRFGGWLVTGAPEFPRHRGNLVIERTSEGARERTIQPGELFDLRRYPVPTSDILPHLLLEHQVGFANRAIQAAYRARALDHEHAGQVEAAGAELDALARGLVRYLLFADEVPLPPGAVDGDAAFKADFLAARRVASNGGSLRDLDLHTRLLRHRCSYMVYSPTFTGLPTSLRRRVDRALDRALDVAMPEPDFAYLPAEEKSAIRTILRETLGSRLGTEKIVR
jgi:hypothetical protein